jgi:anti-sigma-K factor RskA
VEHRELQDLIPAHALDALDADDAHLLDGHLETCEECRRELDELLETTALLAFASKQLDPPESLRAAILDAVAEKTPARAQAPRARLAFLRGAFAGTLVGAAAALVIGLVLHGQLNDARSSRDALQVRPLAGAVRGAVVRNRGNAKLVVVDLRSPSSGHTYEAWLIGSDKKPVAAGLFKGGKTVVVDLTGNAAKAQQVAVTLEPSGGSEQPTTTPFASASLA